MGSFTITVPRLERPIAEIFARMPKTFRDEATRGFTIIGGVSPQNYAAIVQAVLVGLETKEAPLENLEKILKITPTDLSALFSAAMMTVPTLGEGGDVGEFIAAVEKYGTISRDTLTKAQPFLDSIVSQRSIIG